MVKSDKWEKENAMIIQPSFGRLHRKLGAVRTARVWRVAPLCEVLDRRLLLTSSYNVPSITGGVPVTEVYLFPDTVLFDVDVKLNSPTASTIITLTPSSTDSSISIHGNRSGLILHDFV